MNDLASLLGQLGDRTYIRHRVPQGIVSLILRIREECRNGAVRARQALSA